MHYAYIDEEPVIINRPGDGGGGFEGITCFSGGGGMISISRRQQRELLTKFTANEPLMRGEGDDRKNTDP